MLTRPLPHRAAALAPVLLLALGLFGAGVLLPAARADESNRTSDRFEELHVALGAKKTITVTDPAKIAIQDPTIADVRPLNGSDIEISGLTKGRTTMLVWTKADKRFEYQIIVE
jgi:Flp pilus assembly secretin CpaC